MLILMLIADAGTGGGPDTGANADFVDEPLRTQWLAVPKTVGSTRQLPEHGQDAIEKDEGALRF
jgi:hypothetical protein